MTALLSECSDGELATLAQAGRQPAFSELMRRYRDPVFRVVRSHVGDNDDAVDIVQTTFVAAFAAIGRFDSERPFGFWINRIALNKCRDWGRRRAVRKFFSTALLLDAAEMVADEAVTGEAVLDGERTLEAVIRAIARLPAGLKEPLILTAIEGLSQADAATILKISEKAVEARVYRARKALAPTLAQANMSQRLVEGQAASVRIIE